MPSLAGSSSRPTTSVFVTVAIVAGMSLLLAVGCRATGTAILTSDIGGHSERDFRPVGSRQLGAEAAAVAPGTAVATLNGRPIYPGQMRELLMETAGGAVLEEIAIDVLLRERCSARDVEVRDEDIQRELTILRDSLDHDDPQRAARLLDELRSRRALGPRRFNLLLRRNAMLRALIEDDVRVTDEMILAEYDLAYGDRFQVRLITTTSIERIQDAVKRIRGGELFADVAVEISADASAARGGLLEPISPFDPRYPQLIRDTLGRLEVGELSAILSLGESFAIIQMLGRIPGPGVALDEVGPVLEAALRRARERFLMESLAAELLAAAEIVILDPALEDSFQRRRRRTTGR